MVAVSLKPAYLQRITQNRERMDMLLGVICENPTAHRKVEPCVL